MYLYRLSPELNARRLKEKEGKQDSKVRGGMPTAPWAHPSFGLDLVELFGIRDRH